MPWRAVSQPALHAHRAARALAPEQIDDAHGVAHRARCVGARRSCGLRGHPLGEQPHRGGDLRGRRGGEAEPREALVVATARRAGREHHAVLEDVFEEAEHAACVEAIAHVEKEEGGALGLGHAEHLRRIRAGPAVVIARLGEPRVAVAQRGERGELRGCRGAVGRVGVEFVRGGNHRARARQIADPVAGHSVRLRERERRDGALRREARDRGVLAAVDEALVDLVGDQPEIATPRPFRDGREPRLGNHATRRVGRRRHVERDAALVATRVDRSERLVECEDAVEERHLDGDRRRRSARCRGSAARTARGSAPRRPRRPARRPRSRDRPSRHR